MFGMFRVLLLVADNNDDLPKRQREPTAAERNDVGAVVTLNSTHVFTSFLR